MRRSVEVFKFFVVQNGTSRNVPTESFPPFVLRINKYSKISLLARSSLLIGLSGDFEAKPQRQ